MYKDYLWSIMLITKLYQSEFSKTNRVDKLIDREYVNISILYLNLIYTHYIRFINISILIYYIAIS